jgi:hypothetical protein
MTGQPRKLNLPPGFYNNGTAYMAAGRYVAGNLVRWHGDAIQPINGWQRRYDSVAGAVLPKLWADPTTEAARSADAIGSLTLGVDLYIGTNKKIYRISTANTVTDVTPAGFVEQSKDVTTNAGYGMYRYSFGQYGTKRPSSQTRPNNAFSWGFSEWGFWPVAVARGITGEKIHIKRDTDALFVDIPNSPEGVFDVVVTDERIMMAIGDTENFRLVSWSDQENFDMWVPAVTNQAGSYTLAGTGRLLRGVKVLSNILIIGENDAFTSQYIGPPYVYGFVRAGDACGIIGAEAVAVTDSFAAWVGAYNFWIYDGTISHLPCSVLDYFLGDINEEQRSKTQAFTISDFTEVWWLYQSKDSPTGEPDKYIVYNYGKKIWYYGSINRTVGVDSDPLFNVAMVAPDGTLFDHEVRSAGHGGMHPWIETGPLEWFDGERLTSLAYMYPDVEVEGAITMTLSVRDMPQLPERYSVTYELLSPTSTTGIMGRDIRMKLEGSGNNVIWKIGDFRAIPSKIAGPVR